MGLNADGTRRGGEEDESKGDGDGDGDGDGGDGGGGGDGDAGGDGLPDGWVEVPDEASGAVYFYNNETGESRWDRPT